MADFTDHSPIVSQLTQELLDRLGLSAGVTLSVNFNSPNQLYQVLLQSNRPALLIGFHGETLSAIQLFLGQHLHSRIGEWVNLSVNVNDYRERRESSLTALADTAVSQVMATGQPHSLPPMPANERRVVHMYLSENPNVSTSSEGTGRSRCIIVSPKISDKG